jgi:hypothetical protein
MSMQPHGKPNDVAPELGGDMDLSPADDVLI